MVQKQGPHSISLRSILILWHICSKQELWSQINSRCYRTALKQHLFLGNGREVADS
jgi:hypothetical protein